MRIKYLLKKLCHSRESGNPLNMLWLRWTLAFGLVEKPDNECKSAHSSCEAVCSAYCIADSYNTESTGAQPQRALELSFSTCSFAGVTGLGFCLNLVPHVESPALSTRMKREESCIENAE